MSDSRSTTRQPIQGRRVEAEAVLSGTEHDIRQCGFGEFADEAADLASLLCERGENATHLRVELLFEKRQELVANPVPREVCV